MAYNVSNTIVRGETIELGNDNYNNIGPDVVFEDCEFIVRAPARDLVIVGTKVIGGVWKQKRKLSSKQFTRTHFENVRFEGKFYGCRFGDHSDPSIAGIKNCDFTTATLSLCEFCNVDPAEVKTGPWPTIRFERPQQFIDYLKSDDIPDRFKITLNVIADRPDSFTLTVGQANEIGAKSGLDADAVRAIVEGLPGVAIND